MQNIIVNRFGVDKEQILTEYGEELYNLAVNSTK